MSTYYLKLLLWLLLSLPVLVVGIIILRRVFKEERRAEKANRINE